MARSGKIAQLTFKVREELNERLLNNENSTTILPWVNRLMNLEGADAINENNLSTWRAGGFAEWMGRREKLQHTKSLAEFCLQMASAGGGSMDLPAAIAGGQLMEVLEEFDPSSLKTLLAAKPENWIGILDKLSKLQRSKAESRKADQNEVSLKQSERKLALAEKQFQVKTCELFLKWYKDEKAAEIAADKNLKPGVAIDKLRALMFGEESHEPEEA